MMSKTVQEIQKKISPILKKYGVLRPAIFGSVARGEATTESDLDLLVELPSGATLLDLVGLQLELEEILKYKVDVLTYRSLHPLLKDRIEREAVAL